MDMSVLEISGIIMSRVRLKDCGFQIFQKIYLVTSSNFVEQFSDQNTDSAFEMRIYVFLILASESLGGKFRFVTKVETFVSMISCSGILCEYSLSCVSVIFNKV